jgi:hypothetical protein
MKQGESMKRLSPQNQIVLKHLREIGPLTPMSARVNYRIDRLAARIEELRWDFYHPIVTTMHTINHRRYASYSIGF